MENRRLRSRLDGELAKTRSTDRKLKRANREFAIYFALLSSRSPEYAELVKLFVCRSHCGAGSTVAGVSMI